MKHTRAALFAGLTLTAASVGAFVPAHAADTGDTDVTFTITGGLLEVTVPEAAQLATGNTTLGSLDADVSGTLGNVTVTDNQGELVGGWTATISASEFVNTNGTQTSTIPVSEVGYATGLIQATGVSLSVGSLVATSGVEGQWTVTTTAVGNNEATWNPTVTVALPTEGLAAGTYAGTITHSVA